MMTSRSKCRPANRSFVPLTLLTFGPFHPIHQCILRNLVNCTRALGATGGIGFEIVRQAIERGHSVTAFVRSPERLEGFQGCITIKQGDPLNSLQLERAIEGHDAVVS